MRSALGTPDILMRKVIAMNNDNYRLAQKLKLAILVAKLTQIIVELLSMAFNYPIPSRTRYVFA
jgi:hypothetical protein